MSKIRSISTLTALAAAAAMAAAGPASAGPQESAASAAANKNIVETAAEAGQFNTLASLLKKAGLAKTLTGKGPSPCSRRPTRPSRRSRRRPSMRSPRTRQRHRCSTHRLDPLTAKGHRRPPARPLRARPPRADDRPASAKTVITRETLLPRRVTRSPMPGRSPSKCRHGMPLVPGRSAQGCGRRRGLVARPICTVDLMAVAMPRGHAVRMEKQPAAHVIAAVGSPCAAIGAAPSRVRRPSRAPRPPSRCS